MKWLWIYFLVCAGLCIVGQVSALNKDKEQEIVRVQQADAKATETVRTKYSPTSTNTPDPKLTATVTATPTPDLKATDTFTPGKG